MEPKKCTSKPDNCPVCGSNNIAKILYGEPAWSEELGRQIEAGEVEIGGCCIGAGFPLWRCMKCGEGLGELHL